MKAIGIDLGTTNSVAAATSPDVRVLPARGGEDVTPSVVGLVRSRRSTENAIVAGRTAANNAARDPANTVFSIKRLMGRYYGEARVSEVLKAFHFRLADPPAEDADDQGVKVLLDEQALSPVEISARILGQIKADAEIALGETVTHAVITVPAYFEERQRKATEEAGKLAGLEVLRIIDEPTAAAIAFGLSREHERNRVLVYDLGGGTFDVSVIQMTGGQYTVLETSGDAWLGGDDFDRAITKRICEWVTDEYAFDPKEKLEFLVKARIEAERAKIALSSHTSAQIFQTMYNVHPEGEPIDLDLEISRSEFESDIRHLVERTREIIDSTLENQNLSPEDLTSVLLVGGSTAVPLVRETVTQIFGAERVRRDVNPMQCVALGAAILADGFDLRADDRSTPGASTKRVDGVTPMSIGIAAVKGDNTDAFVPIIPKGTPYPLSEPRKRTFYPTTDKQDMIRIPIFEGLSEVATLNEQQGVIEFPLSVGMSASDPVEVSLNLDDNRTLTVEIKVLGTGESHRETVRRDRARAKPADRSESLVDDWREDLGPSLGAARQFLDSYSEYMDPDDRAELEAAIPMGEEALASDDEEAGSRATRILRNKILTSGTASQLFMAERSMRDAPPEVQAGIANTLTALRNAHSRGDTATVNDLSNKLKVAVAELMARHAAVQRVEDQHDYEDKLRVRD